MDHDIFYQQLVRKYRDNTATDEELEVFFQLMREGTLVSYVEASMTEAADQNREEVVIPAAHRVHFLRTAWFKYAAAVVILIGVGAILWNTQLKEKPSVTQTSPIPLQNDVAPGGNKAVLTLADGSHIILDSAASGQLAREANATITKTGDGRIEYQADEKPGNRVLYNTMATPRGGQYQLTLPDGSRVWLNAESSITYPTAFTGNERRVSITGEAYFEVTSDKRKPFRVECIVVRHPEQAQRREGSAQEALSDEALRHPEQAERSEGSNQPAQKQFTIEVLGTHFNVNTYKDEPTNNITLLEGSVKLRTVHTSLTLKPGQQGQLNPETDRLSLAVNPNLEQVMAWKNGVFNFNNYSLPEVMRQLSRWYDVQVIYENEIPEMKFGGKMGRDLKLSQVLKALSAMGVKFRIEGRKLIVT